MPSHHSNIVHYVNHPINVKLSSMWVGHHDQRHFIFSDSNTLAGLLLLAGAVHPKPSNNPHTWVEDDQARW